MSALFLGLDVGTQGTKALLVDAESCAVVARASHAYGLEPGLGPYDRCVGRERLCRRRRVTRQDRSRGPGPRVREHGGSVDPAQAVPLELQRGDGR